MENDDMGKNETVRVRVSADFKKGWVAAAHDNARSESQALIEAMEMWLHAKGWIIENGAPVKPGVYPAVQKEPPREIHKGPGTHPARKIRISGPLPEARHKPLKNDPKPHVAAPS